MAEFCLSCFNRLNDRHFSEDDVTLSIELDLCEGCGQMKRVVEDLRPLPIWRQVAKKLYSFLDK